MSEHIRGSHPKEFLLATDVEGFDSLAEPATHRNIDDLGQARRNAVDTPAWFQQTCPQSQLHHVAYLSMEFMLSEALPIYSGGLGNVAGDQLKTASDDPV
jgi:starch phosphorylase